MKLLTAIEHAEACNLETVEEAIMNVHNHAIQLFGPYDIDKEILELSKEAEKHGIVSILKEGSTYTLISDFRKKIGVPASPETQCPYGAGTCAYAQALYMCEGCDTYIGTIKAALEKIEQYANSIKQLAVREPDKVVALAGQITCEIAKIYPHNIRHI
jgi:hypothetical protein